MPTPYDHIPEELKKQAQADASPKKAEKNVKIVYNRMQGILTVTN